MSSLDWTTPVTYVITRKYLAAPTLVATVKKQHKYFTSFLGVVVSIQEPSQARCPATSGRKLFLLRK